MLKYLYAFLFIYITCSGCSNAQDTVHLFNGTDLNGWYAFEPETGVHQDAGELFEVADGMIRMYGTKAGYLMSDQSFHDFTLTTEFRWNTDTAFTRKNNKLNSGLMYLVRETTPDTLWPGGIQFQIKEGASGDFILLQDVTLIHNGTRTEPGRSVVVKRLADAANPIGNWNTLTVTYRNGTIKQELNGKLVNEGSEPSVTEGRILLQYEGFPIDFRKVDITVDPDQQ
ncbi:DUF1080 domain-containing protein [Saccharicrinis sp. FJH54]|uniref:3-keto-disaccharide hydrolase n=1 Tax=Saccharicrinis sp. FJH54 TaxID=3344665 RepID=UPI0035D51C44